MPRVVNRNQEWNQTTMAGNGNAIWWDFVQDLISQGWRVLGSGDGDSFENDGQTAGTTGTGAGGGFDLFAARPPAIQSITLPSTVAGAGRTGLFANVSGFPDGFGAAWWRIATPEGADRYCEFLFQLSWVNNGVDERMIIRYCSGNQRFDNGASAWERPQVNTGTALSLGNQISADVAGSNTYTVFLTSGNGHVHWVIGDADDDFDFHFWVSRDGFSGEVFSNFGRFKLVGGQKRTDDSDDPDPYVLLCAFETGSASTNHNLDNDDLLRVDDFINVGVSERLEDRTTTTGTTLFPQMIASYGLDDPGVPASKQGHYGVSFWQPANVYGYAYENRNYGANTATVRTVVDTDMKVGRASDDPQATHHFFKGVIKNDLIGWSSRQEPLPVVEKDSTGMIYRVAWGRFHLYWGAAERVEGI